MSELFETKESTPHAVITELEKAYLARRRGHGYRIRVFYGDKETGRDWLEEFYTMGYIGRSTGTRPIPLLIHNARSMGGGGILDDCIVRITVDGRDVYRHPNYHLPTFETWPADDSLKAKGYNWSVFADGKNHANFKTQTQAARWVAFITGKRNSK